MCLLQMNYELQKNVHATENFPFLLLNIPHTQIVKEDLKAAHGPPSLNFNSALLMWHNCHQSFNPSSMDISQCISLQPQLGYFEL